MLLSSYAHKVPMLARLLGSYAPRLLGSYAPKAPRFICAKAPRLPGTYAYSSSYSPKAPMLCPTSISAADHPQLLRLLCS